MPEATGRPLAAGRPSSLRHADPFVAWIGPLDGAIADATRGQDLPRAIAGFIRGGKRLRARVLFAATGQLAARRPPDAVLKAATAIELVHAASLIHDDIVDDCEERRGRPAMHVAAGHAAAVLGGFSLVHCALQCLSGLPTSIRVRLTETARHISRGQLTEILEAGNLAVAPEQRLEIMEKKTASMFGLAAEVGGTLGHRSPEDCSRFSLLGTSFGILFQIADDLDDIFGTAETLGRKPGADVRSNLISLPLAFGLESTKAESLGFLLDRAQTTSVGDLAQIRALLYESGAVDRTYQWAVRYGENAARIAQALPPDIGIEWLRATCAATLERIRRWTLRDLALQRVSDNSPF